MPNDPLAFLTRLEALIQDRLQAGADASYTAELARAGTARIAQKVGEEGVELALAAVSGDRQSICDEAADLLYHVLVLLAVEQTSLANVVSVLERRHADKA